MAIGMLEQLRKFDTDAAQMDETLAMAAFARLLRAEYEHRNTTVPEWLDNVTRRLGQAIESRRRDALEMRLKEISAQETQLLTAAEKRIKLAEERQALEAQLAAK